MENGLLITYCNESRHIDIIKITETNYDIIQKLNLYDIDIYFPAMSIIESYDKKLIIGQKGFIKYYNIYIYSFNNNKYELSTKIKLGETIEHCSIRALKGKILLHNTENNNIKFINTLNGKVIYSTDIDERQIYKYKKDYLLFNSNRVFIFDHKKYCFIKKYQYGSFEDDKMFIVHHILDNYIIAQKGISGHGRGQESIRLYKISDESSVNTNEILYGEQYFEEIQDLYLKIDEGDFKNFWKDKNIFYIQIEDNIYVYQIINK
jgi:hypothetical protein